jgi:hypothetical protein
MWVETTIEVYAVIMARHKKDFCVHSSFSDSTGNGHHFSTGHPEMITEWGFKDADNPLLKIEQRKENEEQKEWETTVFIHYTTSENQNQ